MVSYVPTQTTGTLYRRAKRMDLVNPLNGTQSVNVYEEFVAVLNGNNFLQDSDGFTVSINDMTKTVPLLDTNTGQPTGQTMTYADIYQAMYSAYIMWASQRDAGQTPA